MTDYEKVRAECWAEYISMLGQQQATRYAFDKIFEQAYRYGRWTAMEQAKAQPVSNPDKFDHFADASKMMLRAQAAIAAMQMLFTANPDSSQTIAKFAVGYADDLLAELDKTKENGD